MTVARDIAPSTGAVEFEQPDAETLVLRLSGDWRTHGHLPSSEETDQRLAGGARRVRFDTEALTDWDSGLLVYLVRLTRTCRDRGLELDEAGLPKGVTELLHLAFAVPEQKDTGHDSDRASGLARLGESALAGWDEALEMTRFLGASITSLGRFATGRAQYRRADLWLFVQDTGAQALGIVSLISFLVGVILAFVGAMQLRLFGAEIYVADLVAIGMFRVMAAMMVAITMAGRTGAAYAAQLGTMTVNEEIDALRTLGIDPMDFLVLPRMLALILMMPLLTVYADVVSVLGGALVGVGMLGIEGAQYYHETVDALAIRHFAIGLVQATVFGVLIAVAGCMRGMQSGRSASAVGAAATSAVVTSIVLVIVALAIFTVVFDALGI
jgi:phospholipid/cholesterol/gamma-HCH transport system permease protein